MDLALKLAESLIEGPTQYSLLAEAPLDGRDGAERGQHLPHDLDNAHDRTQLFRKGSALAVRSLTMDQRLGR